MIMKQAGMMIRRSTLIQVFVSQHSGLITFLVTIVSSLKVLLEHIFVGEMILVMMKKNPLVLKQTLVLVLNYRFWKTACA